MKRLKKWQVVVLVIVILALGGGGYGIYAWVGGSGTSSSSTTGNIQLVAAQYGSITNSVSTSGSLIFPDTEQLTFGGRATGTVAEVFVQEGDTVTKGQILAKLDDTSVISLQKAVVQARIALNNVSDTTAAEAAVATAKIALQTAQTNLDNAENPYSKFDILQAENAVFTAETSFTAALNAYDAAETLYLSNPNNTTYAQDYALKKTQLDLAQATLAKAKETLAEKKAGADPLQVELKQKQLEIAQANLSKAEAELAGIQGNIDSLEAQLKQLEIAEAQIALDDALEKLNMATMVAPFDGIVSTVNITADETITAGTVAMEIVDQSVVEISATLDEIDVPSVKVGQRATVTLSSLSDLELSGVVSALSNTGRTQSGVVTYPVSIRVTIPADVQVREGMSAFVDIIVEEASNALRIPANAIGGTTSNPTVRVMVNGVAQERAITVGITDGTWTEVLSGLQEGEQVVIETTTSSSSNTNTSNTNNRQMPSGNFIIDGNFGPIR